MTIDEIINKAFTTDDLANGGLLNPEQSAKFVKGVIDSAVVINECRKVPMKATKKQIDKITYTEKVLQKPPGVGTAPSTVSKPTTSKVTLDAKEVILAIDLGYDSLEDSIEGQGLFNTIMDLTAEEVALEMDDLLLNGDTTGGTADYLEILDGVFKQATSHVMDAEESLLTDVVLGKIYKSLPGKYTKKNNDTFRYYVSHLAKEDFIEVLAGKGVSEAFTRYLLEAQEPAYHGMPVRKVPAIATKDLDVGTPVTYGSDALLVDPRNIIWGVHRDITYEMERKPRKRIVEVTMTMRVDVKLEEADALVKATNIKHSVQNP